MTNSLLPPVDVAGAGAASATPPSLAMYQAILRSHHAGIVFLCDRAHRFVFADGRALRKAQIDPASFLGRQVSDVWPGEAEQLGAQLRAAFAGEETVQDVLQAGRTWRVRMLPVHDDAGAAAWVLAHASDVTRRRETEAALAASEERVRRIIEELPGPVLLLDLDTMAAEFLNPEFCRMLSVSESDLRALGPNFVPTLVHPDDLAFVMERFATLFEAQNGAIVESRFRARRSDGVWLHAHTRNIVFARHANGRPRTMLTVVTDESDRNAAFDALTEAARRLREAQQIGRMGSWEWTPASGALTWSEEMFQVWGIEPAAGAPDYRAFLGTIPEPDRTDLVNVLRGALENSAESFRLDHRVLRPDGVELYVQCRGSIRRAADGRALSVTGTSQDVSELRAALEAVRTSEERYRLAAAVTHDVLYDYVVNGEDQIIWNAALTTVFGYALEADGATTFGWWEDRVHPEDRARVTASLASAIGTAQQTWSEEYRFRKADGQYAVVLDRGYLMRGTDGVMQRVIGSMTDETARRALDARLRQTAKLDALGTLAGGIAHDFNNILTGIVGFADLAREQVDPDTEVADSLQEITAATRRARDLVHQILAFSRKDDARKAPVALGPLVEETRRLIRATFPATVQITVATEAAEQMIVEGDATLLQQSLLNLCLNAEHATRGRPERIVGISLTTEVIDEHEARRRALRPGRYARLAVRDSGHGMSPALIDRVLEPFFTTKPVGEGTGLGLAMVHGVVTTTGGTVEIESTPDVSTTVTMVLPLATARVTRAASTARASTSRQLRVIVVDDEPMIRKVVARLLTRHGHTPLVAATVDIAQELLNDPSQQIDVLLTDQTMPGMTGDMLAEYARSVRPSLSIVLMSGYSGDLTPSRLAELGHPLLLDKPIESDRLAAVFAQIASEG
jgi:PAS domain S-box-containing protein